MLERLREQHVEIEKLTASFAALIDDPAPDMAMAGELRWELCRKMLDHIAQEDRFVCERLIATGNAQAIGKTLGFRADLGALSVEVLRYRAEWPLERMRSSWPEFCAASRAMLQRIRKRCEREDQELYPLAERLVYAAGR